MKIVAFCLVAALVAACSAETVKMASQPWVRSYVATNAASGGVDTNAVLGLIAAATNELEGAGTDRQIIRGSNSYGPWNISVSDAQYAQAAQNDVDGRSIVDTYAERYEVEDLHAQVNSLGDHYNEISGTVSAWQTYWDGDDVRVTVTNYYGSKDIPSLYLEQKMPSDETHDSPWFKVVWDERTRWNLFLPAFASLTNDVAQNKADRAWGVYDSSTGAYSPDGLLQLSQEQIMIASGMAWQKTVTIGGGSVWILTATTPFVMSGESTNGFFQITDGDGHALFEIVKGDKQIVPATPTSCVKYIDGFSVGFSVDSNTFQHPVGEVAPDVDGPYVPEDSLDGFSVTWNGESGYWVATVTATPPHAMPKKMFFRATYESGGETYIRHSAPISGGILCTDGVHKVRPVYNNGAITWTVVQ